MEMSPVPSDEPSGQPSGQPIQTRLRILFQKRKRPIMGATALLVIVIAVTGIVVATTGKLQIIELNTKLCNLVSKWLPIEDYWYK